MALNMSVLTLCKFTPLGFETTTKPDDIQFLVNCVNLPRWGLKQAFCVCAKEA